MKTKTISKYLALGTIALGLVGTTQATPTLQISDGVNTVTITDNGVGDGSGVLGGVSYTGSLGSWVLAISSGVTKPLVGSATSPFMHLSGIGTSSGGGSITFMFSETNFTGGGGAFAAFGGSTSSTNSISYATYWSPTNTLFAMTNPLTNSGPVFGPSPGGTASGGIQNEGAYSLTQVLTITHRGTASSSADADLSVPDSGSTLALLGAALAAVGLVSRRRQKNAA